MEKVKYSTPSVMPLLLAVIASAAIAASSFAAISTDHTTDEIEFDSGKFHLVGDLRLPVSGDQFPVVVFVHGDGRATRTQNGFYFPTMDVFLSSGFAVFSYDKPGSGESTGSFDGNRLRQERADILVDAIAMLKRRAEIVVTKIGLWGISQAGWVMPLAIENSNDIRFMVVVSGGGENGINQMGYLLRSEAICAGYPDNEAASLDDMWVACMQATSYDEYVALAPQLVAHPIVKAADCMCCVTERDKWSPKNRAGEGFLDPMPLIEKCGIPVLAFFGEKDTAVDPVQGVEAYENALEMAGNPLSRVVYVHGVDHDMIPAETGCPSERRGRTLLAWCSPGQEYLDQLEDWLGVLP